ncbi:MAG: ATP-binding protein [Actinomycetota bacterium]
MSVASADLLELLPTAACLTNATSDVKWANKAFRDMFDWHLDEHDTLNMRDVIDPSSIPFVVEMQHRLTAGETDRFDMQARFVTLANRIIDVELHAVVVDRYTAPMLLMSLTPSGTSEFETQNPFRRALESQGELISEWAPDGTVLFCNRVYRDFFGYDESIIGQRLDGLIEWEPGNSREKAVNSLLEDASSQTNTRSYPNGTWVEWTNTLLRTQNGNVISVVSVGRDVTDRVEAEAVLRRNEARFRTMVTHIWDTILLLDRDGRLIESTAQFRHDLDYPPGFWQQANLLDVVYPGDHELVLAEFGNLLAGGLNTIGSMELRAKRFGGGESFLELHGVNLLDDPAVNAVIITVRNIDDRKRIEFELAERHAESQLRLRNQLAFIAKVSHELRNPLHGMLALSELLTRASLEPQLAEAANALYRQSTTLRRIVDDLLDFAQLEIGNLRTRQEMVDLQVLLADVAAVTRGAATIDVDLTASAPPEHLRWIACDGDRARQVLANLLSNACKHTHTGSVTIESSDGEQPNMVRISVLDTGTGIDPADIPRLFEPYQRGADTSGAAGAGLGLAIAKGLVDEMGGRIGAAPRPEGGSMFWIELPLANPAALGAEGARGVDHGDARAGERRSSVRGGADHTPPHVLVIEDDPVNRMVANLQLGRMGIIPELADDGEQAWELLQQNDYDVVFVDVQLPGIDGLEVVRRARANLLTQPLMAVMTAGATAADQSAALAAGADMFVPKPATLADIAAVLARLTA